MASLHNGRYFVFTWNNPNLGPDEFHASFAGTGCGFLVFAREKGTNGTEHYQGYVEFSRNKGVRQLKSINSQIHWENREGTQAQAIAYCEKHCSNCYRGLDHHSEDVCLGGPWRYGEPVALSNTGMSVDFPNAVKEGKRMRELFELYPDDMRKYPRYAENLRQVFPPPQPDSAPAVTLLIGEPGVGKTRYVHERETPNELFVKPCDRDFWMNGYDLHPAVLLDDFAGASNHVSLTNLLQLLDRYQIRVSTKNGHTWWQPKRIYITTNIHPANWYDYKDRMVHYRALQRRFTCVREIHSGAVVSDMSVYTPDEPVPWIDFWDYEQNHNPTTFLPGRCDVAE